MRVLDGIVIIVDAVSGVQAQTRKVWNQARKRNIPAVAFVNKMDRDGACFQRSIDSMRNKLGINAIPIQFPCGYEKDFTGVIDLLSLNKIIWPSKTSTRNPEPPMVVKLTEEDKQYEEAIEARNNLIEALAELDDKIMEAYLEDPSILTLDALLSALRYGCISNKIVPVICGASLRGKGIEPLLDSISAFLPSPNDRPPEIAVAKQQNDTIKKINILPSSDELCALAFKVTNDNARGPLVYVRVFSGILEDKSNIFNPNKNCRERINQVLKVSADDLEKLNSVESGNVCCIVGLKNTLTGDTLVTEKGPLHNFVLDGLDLPRRVFSLCIEPEKSSQQTELEKVLKILVLEDPSLSVELNAESGQLMISGIGELHLEIVCDKIKRQYGIEVSTGKAYIAYRETLELGTVLNSRFDYNKVYGPKRFFASLEYTISSSGDDEKVNIHIENNVKKIVTADEYNAIVDGLTASVSRGPKGFPVTGLTIKITNAERDHDTTPGSFQACASSFMDSVLKSTDHILLEPIMSIEIDLPTSYVGDILSDFTFKRRGTIKEVVSSLKGERSLIYGQVPFETMLGYATSLRSMTQGEGNFSLEYLKHSKEKFLES